MLEQLAWPGVVLVAIIIFFIFFYKPITRLIDRINKVGPKGFETTTPAVQETTKNVEPSSERVKHFDNALLVKYEAKVKAELDSRGFRAPSERENFLIRSYTGTYVGWAFEKIYLQIFGSQISVLHLLNTRGTAGAEVSEVLNGYFLPAKNLYPQVYNTYTFDQWMYFLTYRELVSMNGTKLMITLEAKEFLKYIVEQGYDFNKPF